MSRLVCACGKSYDVSARAPGTKVRCRACETVLVVPAPRKLEAAMRIASERLRRARGEPCAKHPRSLALDPCERCERWMCEACLAKPPSSHLCRACAPAVGATEALPVDFGLLATPAIAARLMLRGLPWVFVLNFIAHTIKWMAAIPFIALTFAIQKNMNVRDPQVSEFVAFVAAYALVGLVVTLFEVVLIPAADILLFDRVMRNEPPAPFGMVLADAVRRAWERKGSLVLTFLILVAALLGSLIVILPFVLLFQLTEDRESLVAGILFTIPAAGAVLGAFGLSIPAVILEHRSAPAAFGRAWTLARLRPLVAATFGTIFVFVGAIIFYRLVQFEQAWGLLPSLLVAFAADIAWPALLVAAYHGLVAEEAQLVGRRS